MRWMNIVDRVCSILSAPWHYSSIYHFKTLFKSLPSFDRQLGILMVCNFKTKELTIQWM